MGPGSPDPLSSPEPPITCGHAGAASGSFSALPRCAWQAQPSLNDTLPASPLAGVGGEGARPSLGCGFFFHCVRPQGPARLPAAGWHRGIHSHPCLPPLQTPCAPRFGHLEASSQRVSWGWGTCPLLGVECPFPTHPSLRLSGACGLIQVGWQWALRSPTQPDPRVGPGPPGHTLSQAGASEGQEGRAVTAW